MLSRWLLLLTAGLASLFAQGGVTNGSPVHLLVPGFTVQELPVKLSNQNNLRFAPDGTLTSLGYDGKVWRLRDTNGDGLEDTAEPFWDRPTLSVPLGMAWSTRGLYVSSKGKVSLLRDTDGDDRADTEDVIASGWPATDVGSGGVDATAVTLDKDGNLFFGLLVADYSNAYRLRKRSDLKPAEVDWLKQNGRWQEPTGPDAANDEFSLYDLNSQRGTIQKFDPRTKRLETVATGLRVPVALAFNREGDLFNTDQEGETWMPHGNPLDELNHIILGRNYGFPPRHERWLPDLASEPPVVAFGPQHQSACGLVFNEPRVADDVRRRTGQKSVPPPHVGGYEVPLPAFPAQGLFGPKWWEGDAFVASESRGKIWRVRLVKTPHGYVGKSYTIARLDLLTLDLAISPKGDLYVCCHSGPPDWGTGPQGEGKIFKISYTDTKAPQPVAVWPASGTEVRIAFDRPLDPGVTNAVRGDAAKIEFGEYVSAGDRFEVLKPPYAVVEQQDATPRGSLLVHQAQLRDENRTLLLTTDPHPLSVLYCLAFDRWEVAYDFNGVYILDFHKTNWGKLPRVVKDAALALGFGARSLDEAVSESLGLATEIEANRRLLPTSIEPRRSGLGGRIRTRLDLPLDTGGVSVRSKNAVSISYMSDLGDRPGLMSQSAYASSKRFPFGFVAELQWNPTHNSHEFWIEGDDGAPSAFLTYFRKGDNTERIVPLQNMWLPWAPTNRASAGTDSRPAPKPQGDWEHGRELFTGTALNCAKCHRIRGEGGLAGPDLSNLIHRDARSVERDIREPSATLHPDYVTYLAELKNGDSLTGFIRSQSRTGSLPVSDRGASSPRSRGETAAEPDRLAARPTSEDAVVLFDADGKDTVIPRTDLANLHPTGQSLMPTGLLDSLKPDDVRDLLTFLLWEPPLRAKAEAERVLAASSPTPTPALSPPVGNGKLKTNETLRIVLVASKQDHGPGQHDYPHWQEKWMRLLALAATNAVVEKAWEWPTAEQFATANVLVFYFWNHDWSPARYAQLDAYQQRGGGVVILHSACIADRKPEQLAERIGLSAQPGTVSYRHMPFDLHLVAREHPLTRGLPEWLHFLDEPYWPLIGDLNRVNVLAEAIVDGAPKPLVWTHERAGQDGRRGRVFGSILGHYFWTLDDPLYRLLVLRAIAWTGGADLNRLTDAALLEAAVK